MDIMELKLKRKNIISQQKNLLDIAENGKRNLNSDEETKYQELELEFDSLTDEINNNEINITGRMIPTQIGNNNENRNITGVNNMDNYIYDPKGKDYRNIFNRYLIYGDHGLSAQERMMLEDKTISRRNLMTDSDSGGGFLAHSQLAKDIIQDLNQSVVIRDISRKMEIADATSLKYPAVANNIGDLEWTSELSSGSEDDEMKFDGREFFPHPLARSIRISRTLLRKSGINVESLVREQFAYKIGTVTENAFLNGDGQNKPLGIFTPHPMGINTDRDVSEGNTTSAVTYDGFVNTLKAIPPAYRKNLHWVISAELQARTLLLKSGDGIPLWQPDLKSGVPTYILGYPVVISSFVPQTFSSSQYVGILGNFDYFMIVTSLAMDIQVLTERWAMTNQNGYIARIEEDANVLLSTPFARMKLADS